MGSVVGWGVDRRKGVCSRFSNVHDLRGCVCVFMCVS